ncbi:OLC1v1017212C1 [Oldenlandia corymbosa var. corymbosa]|uniref:OLC1v1017212C1 n=1 Tax=Oldenlandia corymbosa var. corymbosa TaxID=529605 RepID=A0AAV1E8W0_OLDCO|nr:OLC1v1017212C1 [Oldenlandia corymbosa var. corymbosa]
MEESEKRRERLKAMRMEAAQGRDKTDAEGYSVGASNSLGNPLAEAPVAPSVHGEPSVARRFDFYTDPMSAFSGNKSQGKVSHQNSPDYLTAPRPRNVDSFPAYQNQAMYPPDPRMFQAPGFHRNPCPSGPSRGPPSTFGISQQDNMNVAPGTYGFPSNMSRGGHFPRPDFVPRGSPSFNYGESRGYGINNSPQTGFGNWSRPYPHPGRGRTQWYGGNNSQTGSSGPYHQSGRGRGYRQGNNNSGSMHTGRRTSSHENVSAEIRPDLYYDKSMVEDPWETLKPVVRRRGGRTSLEKPNSPESWVPKSITSKKARVSEASTTYSDGKSLAEELAASFHAAAAYEPHDDNA